MIVCWFAKCNGFRKFTIVFLMSPRLLMLTLWLSLATSSAFAYYRSGSKLQLHGIDTRAMAYLRPLSAAGNEGGILKEEPRPAPIKPDWAAGGLLSDFVNMLISFKPLFGMMKVGARKTLISTAEKNNIPWRALTQDLRTKMDVLSENYKQVLDNTITEYPSYYTQQFHAYDDGNLNWDAAFECESATMSMAIRTWPKEPLTVKQAQDRLRASFTDAIKQYMDEHEVSLSTVRRVLDVGCSVGVSTFYLADAFPAASAVDGLDLSPYFLAVARGRQLAQCGLDYLSSDPATRPDASKYNHINWVHANIERTPFADNAYDIAACSFIFHELPTDASVAIFKELYRIVNSGGVVAITDLNPQSPVIQSLPPMLFTLMKSTEPWSDEYYCFDIEQALRSVGFCDVVNVATDPRHRSIIARKPLS